MIINHIPTRIKGLISTEITLLKGDGVPKSKSIMVIHDIPITGHPDSIKNIIINWLGSTSKHDSKSLVMYIKSKEVFRAYTVEEFKDLKV